ncbi:MAG: CinA family nicotinamide mononucleotide deamidase-related protein [Phycisphaerales bacterium]|nr:CinA family nicotinamide mononucleotide deamidase-related protein [Phycisphaerales bacterium]
MADLVHHRVVVISTGDEIITGQLIDTNSAYIADGCVRAGILPVEHRSIPDELSALVDAFRAAASRAPLVIISGGLGPTDGDLTRQALAEVLSEELVIDGAARAAISDILVRRGRPMTARQERQALRPRSATCLPNQLGTAPGLHARASINGAAVDFFCLPGPPGELRPMFEREVEPRLRPPPGTSIITRLLHIVGVAEADCVSRLGDLTRRDGSPLVGITASGGILTVRIRCEGAFSREAANALVDQAESRARAELGDHLFASGDGPGARRLVQTLLGLLKESGQTLAVVESCTGGMLGQFITDIPGSSAAFLGGYQTYANTMKESLGVDPADLRTFGAVSPQVARGMAEAGLVRSGADWCLAVTGIAGPEGGTDTKPVGTVHIGLARRSAPTHTRRFLFTGDRQDVRARSCVSAMAMLYFALRHHPIAEPRLLWQVG